MLNYIMYAGNKKSCSSKSRIVNVMVYFIFVEYYNICNNSIRFIVNTRNNIVSTIINTCKYDYTIISF